MSPPPDPEYPTEALGPDEAPTASGAGPLPDRPTELGPVRPVIAAGSVPPDGAPVVPGYEHLVEIARGGMGVVYRARDVALSRDVAVKVLPPSVPPGSPTARRFREEAQITAQLQHPGVPAVYAAGALADGRPFLAMKLIKGRTLADLLDDAPDRGQLLAVFEHVCHAVAYAHDRGVIHRDLKPANVMVGAFDEVQVMDWGLAKVLADDRTDHRRPDDDGLLTEIRSLRDADSATQAGSVLGTPAYMPPEQAGGETDKVDERADVFGLGAILCALLTGIPPYAGGSAEQVRLMAIRGKLDDAFDRLDRCGAEPELVALAKRCLAPERGDRPRNAGEVAGAVAGLRAAAEERARQAELDRARAEGTAAEERKRRKVQRALGLAVAAVVGLVAFGLWWQDRQATRRERERSAAREEARRNLGAALDRTAAAFGADRLPEADASLDRAAELLDAADDPGARGRYDDLRADRAAVTELDRVWVRANVLLDDQAPGGARRIHGGLRFDEDAARTGYPAAFAARGLAVGAADPGELADRITRSPIRDRLIAALDDWLPVARPDDRPRLCDLLARVDPDPARNEIRRAHAEPRRLTYLFGRPPTDSALRVAARAARAREVPDDRAASALRVAAARLPGDFPTQYAAGVRRLRPAPAMAVEYFSAAVALRPDNLAAVNGLGLALHHSKRPGEAAPYYLRAIEIDPDFVSAYLNLADAIKLGADRGPAVAFFEREVARDPNRAMAHFGLGMVLRDSARAENRRRAVAAFGRSIELDPLFAPAHNYLGYTLGGRGNLDARICCYRRAIELDPEFAFPHYNLANALEAKGDVPGAVAEYRRALELFPDHTFSHYQLGITLAENLKDPLGAAFHFQRVIQIDPDFSIAYPWLARVLLRAGNTAGAVWFCRECVKRFPDWYEGYDNLILALGRQGAHVEAVRVYQQAVLRADPTWPDSARRQLRYNAACSAALAGTGQGRDAPPPADRAAYRRQALDWLRAESEGYRKALEGNPAAARAEVRRTMRHWLADEDLKLVRDPAAVGRLPADERDGWAALWADVRGLLARSAPPEVAPPPRKIRPG